MLSPVAPDLWEVTRPLRSAATFGLAIGKRMSVLRLADGSLLLHSPVDVDDAEQAAIDALGPVSAIMVPNTMHTMHFRDAARRWPGARLFAPPAVAAKAGELRFAEGPAPLDAALRHHTVGGQPKHAETVLFHAPSESVVFTDILFHFPTRPDWWTGWYASMAGVLGKPGVTPIGKTVFSDRAAAKPSVELLRSWGGRRVVVSHGAAWEGDVPALLGEAFRWLG